MGMPPSFPLNNKKVDGLKIACAAKGAVAYEIENHGVPGLEAGVGRSLVEVQMF